LLKNATAVADGVFDALEGEIIMDQIVEECFHFDANLTL
jgi:hypothetical protein